MNILHLTLGIPQLRAGGLVMYSYSVALAEAELGHHVSLLYPGNLELKRRGMAIRKRSIGGSVEVYKLINPSFVAIPLGVKEPKLIMQTGNKQVYAGFLDTLKPDIVHVHSFMGFHKELFEEIKSRKIPIVYTTHDYYPICPKTSRINERNENCEKADAKKCAICNANVQNSRIMQYILQSEWYPRIKKSKILIEMKKKRKGLINETADTELVSKAVQKEIDSDVIEEYQKLLEYQKAMFDTVDVVHCNSTLTEEIFTPYLLGKKHFVLNITTIGVKDLRREKRSLPYKESGILNIGFIGIRDFHKGYWLLRDAGEILYKNGLKFKIRLYGDEFNISKEQYPFCEEKGMFEHKELSNIMRTVDLLVVPGYWYETFGFSAMEAIANSVPVLVSTHTGSKDLLQNMRTPHFFEPDAESLAEILKQYINNYDLLEEARSEQDAIPLMCSMSEHVKLLMEEINKRIEVNKE